MLGPLKEKEEEGQVRRSLVRRRRGRQEGRRPEREGREEEMGGGQEGMGETGEEAEWAGPSAFVLSANPESPLHGGGGKSYREWGPVPAAPPLQGVRGPSESSVKSRTALESRQCLLSRGNR